MVLLPSRRPSAANALVTQTIRNFPSETAEVIGRHDARIERTTVLLLAVMVVAMIVLAGIIQLDRVVTSPGRMVSIEGTLVVQPLEVAIIKSIKVQQGEIVHKGQSLATLDPTFTTADVSDLQHQVVSLSAEIARLTAERDGKEYLAVPGDGYSALQAQIWAQRHSEHAGSLNDFDERLKSLNEQSVRATKDVEFYRSRLQLQEEIEGMRTTLEKHEVGSHLNSLIAKDNRLEVARNLSAAENTIQVAGHDIEALKAQRVVYNNQWHDTLLKDLVIRQNSLDTAMQQLSKAQKRQDLVDLQAPEDAVVLNIAKVSVGSVVQGAEELFTLVPVRSGLEAEVDMDAKDQGFVQPGDPVEVKLDAYRYLQHGTLKGVVKTISSDSFTQKDNSTVSAPYYRARVEITSATLRNVPPTFRLIPGMPLQADIIVGHRTILSYILEGAIRNVDEGMREP
jgi:hemolysin D